MKVNILQHSQGEGIHKHYNKVTTVNNDVRIVGIGWVRRIFDLTVFNGREGLLLHTPLLCRN